MLDRECKQYRDYRDYRDNRDNRQYRENRENSLTFQNITHSMKINKAKASKHGLCFLHSERIAKFRNKLSLDLYCVSCAIQEASRGALLEDISKIHPLLPPSCGLSLLQEVYQQSQEHIQECIRLYNSKYQQLLDALTDLQIRDLIAFNRQIEQNHSLYKKLKENISNWDRNALLNRFSNPNALPTISHIQKIIEDVATLECQNQQKCSRVKSKPGSPLPYSRYSRKSSGRGLPQSRSQDVFEEEFTLRISDNSCHEPAGGSKQVRQSFTKSQPNTGSFYSKTSAGEQMKKSVLEDTPQSVKVMVSQGGLKLPKEAAVTMFEKIDICESVNLAGSGGPVSVEQGSSCSQRKKNRYIEDDS